jgi:hypothetical protein
MPKPIVTGSAAPAVLAKRIQANAAAAPSRRLLCRIIPTSQDFIDYFAGIDPGEALICRRG